MVYDFNVPHVNFYDPDLFLKLQTDAHNLFEFGEISPELDFFLHLAVNHSILINKNTENKTNEDKQISYSFSSPDEGTLVCLNYTYSK